MSMNEIVTVESINKQGNKIKDYSCKCGDTLVSLTRDQLIEKIHKKEVTNARIQVYKGQTIIRVNLDDKTKSSITSENTTKTEKKQPKQFTSQDLMNAIAKKYNVKYINEYSERFFDKNISLRDKIYSNENIEEKIKAMRKMNIFWRLVAYKQADLTFNSLLENLDNMEYELYCKENNINIEED